MILIDQPSHPSRVGVPSNGESIEPGKCTVMGGMGMTP